MAHLSMFIFKQKHNEMIGNRRNVNTREHDALLFTVICPKNEKYKRNIYYNGAQRWNKLSVKNRNIDKYGLLKSNQKQWLLRTINLRG